MIKIENGKKLYFDKYGNEITEGCQIKYLDGTIKKVYLTEDGELGTDATNPIWIAKGKATECEFGVYPLDNAETNEVEIINAE